jgi:hypothetical protein
VNIKLIDKFIFHRHEGYRTMVHFHYPDAILFQNMIAEIILILVKEMAFFALKIRQGFFTRHAP